MNRNPTKRINKEKDRRDRLNVTRLERDMARKSGRKPSREGIKIGVN